jgi:hypothetical protein
MLITLTPCPISPPNPTLGTYYVLNRISGIEEVNSRLRDIQLYRKSSQMAI